MYSVSHTIYVASSVMQKTLIIIPVYNSAKYLPELITRLEKVVAKDQLLFINDGSTDQSLEIIKSSNLNHISFDQNRGKGAALQAGFKYAIDNEYDSVLTLDSDLQHRPEEIPNFLAADDGQSIIVGARPITRSDMPIHRRLSNSLTSLIVSIFMRQTVKDSQSGFRLIPTDCLRQIELAADGFDLESELLLRAGAAGLKVKNLPITTIYHSSPSSIRHVRDTLRFLRQLWRRVWL